MCAGTVSQYAYNKRISNPFIYIWMRSFDVHRTLCTAAQFDVIKIVNENRVMGWYVFRNRCTESHLHVQLAHRQCELQNAFHSWSVFVRARTCRGEQLQKWRKRNETPMASPFTSQYGWNSFCICISKEGTGRFTSTSSEHLVLWKRFLFCAQHCTWMLSFMRTAKPLAGAHVQVIKGDDINGRWMRTEGAKLFPFSWMSTQLMWFFFPFSVFSFTLFSPLFVFTLLQNEFGKRSHNNQWSDERFEAVPTSSRVHYARPCAADAHHRVGGDALFSQFENRQSPDARRKEDSSKLPPSDGGRNDTIASHIINFKRSPPARLHFRFNRFWKRLDCMRRGERELVSYREDNESG